MFSRLLRGCKLIALFERLPYWTVTVQHLLDASQQPPLNVALQTYDHHPISRARARC